MHSTPQTDTDLQDTPGVGVDQKFQGVQSAPTGRKTDAKLGSTGTKGKPALSFTRKIYFVLPAYNEQESLPPLLDRIEKEMTRRELNYEVIVVDDGSADDTAMIASQASFRMPLQLVQHEKNKGLGGAIRTGLETAAEAAEADDLIVTMDADNTQPPELVQAMVDRIQEGKDIVVASRYQKGGQVTGLAAHRHLLSYGARWMFTLAFPTRGLRDFTSGFRAYRASMIQKAIETYGDKLVTEPGFACMTDLMIKIRRLKPKVCEVPMVLRYDNKIGESKMRVVKTVFDSFKLIAKRRIGIMS